METATTEIATTTGTPAVGAATFDYASLEEKDREIVIKVTGRLHVLKRAADKAVLAHAEKMGAELLKVREKFDGIKGGFGKWFAIEFGMSVKTAYNWMGISSHYGKDVEALQDYPANLIYRLASAKEEAADDIRVEVLERAKEDDPIPAAEIETKLREAAAAAKVAAEERKTKEAKEARAEARKKLNPTEREKAEWKREDARERSREKKERENRARVAEVMAERHAKEDAVAQFLVDRLGDDVAAFLALLDSHIHRSSLEEAVTRVTAQRDSADQDDAADQDAEPAAQLAA